MLFILSRFRMWWNGFREYSFGKSLKFFFFVLVGYLMLSGLFFGFKRLLGYLATVPIIGQLLIIKLLSMVFLFAFVMIIISSLITAFSTMYFSKDLEMWMVSPFPTLKIFLYKAGETMVYSSWMILLAVLPFLLAYGAVNKLGIAFYVLLAFLLVPFMIIPSSLGIGVGLLLMSVCPRRKLRDGIIIVLVVGGSLVYITFRLMQPETLIQPDVFEQVLQYIAVLQTPTAAYLPSWWITSAVREATLGGWNDSLWYGILLCCAAAGSVGLLSIVARWFFYKGWTGVQEGVGKSRTSVVLPVISSRGSPLGSIIVKDVRSFMRDVNQWTQLLLLGALIVVYLFSIHKLPLDTLYLKSLVSFLNIGMVGFVLAAIALRFIFPAVSLEGKNYWILSSAPISPLTIMMVKFFYMFPLILVTGLILSLVSNLLLNADRFVQIMSFASVVLIAITLSGMGIGMGSAFPYFNVENIARIESSAGGIFFMICSFFYIGLVIAVMAVPMRMYVAGRIFAGSASVDYGIFFIAWGILLIISGMIFITSILYGARKLTAYE
ncbi:MAG: hypothetical protein GF384_08615 [Elusimicrobia bacterium]|nr:hypothetical protein [Elusimicrobiota bacterium]MBD3412678.1 hypothetical protein [Elusimicrobiota bacterium]